MLAHGWGFALVGRTRRGVARARVALRRLGAATALLLALASPACPGQSPLLINFDRANPPFMYDRDGIAAGVYPALVRAAFSRMGAPAPQLRTLPWARALQDIDRGSAGVGGLYKNQQRLEKYDFSELLLVEELHVYFAKARPLHFARLDDLLGLRVGVVRGWSYGDAFDQARRSGLIRVEEVISDEQNFQKLSRGRLDAVICVAEAGHALMPLYPDVAEAAQALTRNPTYLAFAKSAQQTALLERFNAALRQMQRSGEFARILANELRNPATLTLP